MDRKNNSGINKVIPLFVRPGGGAAVEVADGRRNGREEAWQSP